MKQRRKVKKDLFSHRGLKPPNHVLSYVVIWQRAWKKRFFRRRLLAPPNKEGPETLCGPMKDRTGLGVLDQFFFQMIAASLAHNGGLADLQEFCRLIGAFGFPQRTADQVPLQSFHRFLKTGMRV